MITAEGEREEYRREGGKKIKENRDEKVREEEYNRICEMNCE